MHIVKQFKVRKSSYYVLSDGRTVGTTDLLCIIGASSDTFYKRQVKFGLTSPKMFTGDNKKTHCRNGHKRTPGNIAKDGSCLACRRARTAKKAVKPKIMPKTIIVVPKEFSRTETCWRHHIECEKYMTECFDIMVEKAEAGKKFTPPSDNCWTPPPKRPGLKAVNPTDSSFSFGF